MVKKRSSKGRNGNHGPRPSTLSVWGGEERGSFWQRATQVPVVHSVAYGYEDLETWQRVARGEAPGHIYSRNTNPTVQAFEEKVRLLEGAEAATSAATGMGAISSTLFALLRAGHRLVSIIDTYGGTNRIFAEFLPRFDIDVELCATTDPAAIEAALSRGCDLFYLESPTNPTNHVMDLERLSRAGRDAGATVVVDNTLATPINQNPLALGADVVVHSATKFLGGHADALGGVVCGSEELVRRVFRFREINGATLHPEAAYLLLRGMKTLALRVERQNQSALRLARFLEAHPRVAHVFYPGLPSHPNHEVARRQMRGFGGVLSFVLEEESLDAVSRLLARLRFAHAAANLGSVETVVGPPATTSHVELSPQERYDLGIAESLVRYSVGIEDADDLEADLDQALGG